MSTLQEQRRSRGLGMRGWRDSGGNLTSAESLGPSSSRKHPAVCMQCTRMQTVSWLSSDRWSPASILGPDSFGDRTCKQGTQQTDVSVDRITQPYPLTHLPDATSRQPAAAICSVHTQLNSWPLGEARTGTKSTKSSQKETAKL